MSPKKNFIVVLRSLVYCIFCTFARILNKIEGSYVVSHNFLLVLMSVLIICLSLPKNIKITTQVRSIVSPKFRECHPKLPSGSKAANSEILGNHFLAYRVIHRVSDLGWVDLYLFTDNFH